MIRTLVVVGALGLLFALGTVALGWWVLPFLGLVVGLVLGRRGRPGRLSAIAGAVAWGGVLVAYRFSGYPVTPFLRRLAGAMQLPEWGLLGLTLLFPALLAGTAAALGGALRTSERPAGRSA